MRQAACISALLALGGGLGLGCGEEPVDDAQPAGWDDELRLATLPDLDDDPKVVELELEAREEGFELVEAGATRLWSYAGSLPGPLIRAKVGDRLVVRFTNHLPEPTTIHWHGLRISAAMDGVPDHPHPPVAPGESFVYDFVLPDAGTYWYHPHFHSAAQLGNGLYGALVVDPAEAEPEGLGDEVVLVLSDVGIADDGSLKDAEAGGDLAGLFGREGNVLLVNGRVQPTLGARIGKRQRWRIVNAAKSRYFQLELAGHTFTQIGNDGGFLGAPVELDRVLVVPGQRADVVVTPTGAPGQELELRWIPYDRGYGSSEFRDPETLMKIALSDQPAVTSPALPDTRRAIEAIDPTGATRIEIELTSTQISDNEIELGIDGVPGWQAAPLRATVGETQLWSVTNTIDWAHPFHLHGFFFQEVDREGTPLEPRAWRDTLDVARDETKHFLVRYDHRPGTWMFHCHVLDHSDMGMMGMIQLDD